MGLKAYESTSFTLQDCRVPAANLLGGEERNESSGGFKTAMRTFNAGRPIVAANAWGWDGRPSTRLSPSHASTTCSARCACAIASRPARKLKMARLLCLRAGWLADQERPNIVEASMSKAIAAQVGLEATSLGMELIGSVGAAAIT